MIWDFRSDTVTRPCQKMMAAIAEAAVGDDVYGEDPSVNRLEADTAALLGKQAGLFVPSGSMANQMALHLHTRPGDAVICEPMSHIFTFEAGGPASLSGLQPVLLEAFTAEDLHRVYIPENLHRSPTTLLVIENSHNVRAGRVLSPDQMAPVVEAASSKGLKRHCDGARLWNAAQALRVDESVLAAPFDSVSVCFSKGLGAPVGSVLVGSEKFIYQARRVRKRWGGAMRQSGILGAAAQFALENNRARLVEDHEGAATFAQAFAGRIALEYPNPGTNMVYFQLEDLSGDQVVSQLHDQGILLSHLGQNRCRLVWHKDIKPQGTRDLIKAMTSLLDSL